MRKFTVFMMLSLLVFSGCSAKRPVLYPNDLLKEVGKDKANQEIDDCFKVATEYKAADDKTKEIATDAGKASVVGMATGAVIGIITGNIGKTIAIGGAAAATAATGSGLMRSDDPGPVFKQFVDQCLRDKGFQPLGWR